MTQVVNMPVRRQVGSLTSNDLGTMINVEGRQITVLGVLHVVDEESGIEYSELYTNPSRIFPMTVVSDLTFTVVEP